MEYVRGIRTAQLRLEKVEINLRISNQRQALDGLFVLKHSVNDNADLWLEDQG